MLTQMELVGSAGGLGMDEDSGTGSSPLDDLPQYPMEQAEFEYFETSLGDNDGYYDVPSTLTVPPALITPDYTTAQGDAMIYDPITTIASQHHHLKFSQELANEDEFRFSSDISHYQDLKSEEEELKFSQSIMQYQSMESCNEDIKTVKIEDDMSSYEDLKTQEEELKFPQSIMQYHSMDACNEDMKDIKAEDDMSSYEEFSGSFCDESFGASKDTSDDFGLGSLHNMVESGSNLKSEVATQAGWGGQGGNLGSGKGKIGPLQRRALDSIFRVTEKPSRGMALHIASELGLHYVTVKNFFSNGRRRLRRAAAKLSNPERSRRENERRKEKRRLSAMASAATQNGGDGKPGLNVGRVVVQSSQMAESPQQKDSPIVSPERKALMEKLADKVQRSVAQRSLAAEFDMVQPNNVLTQSHVHKFPSQPTPLPTLELSESNLLPNTILNPSDQALLNPSPQDFLTTHTTDLDSASPTLLNPHNDPWNLF